MCIDKVGIPLGGGSHSAGSNYHILQVFYRENRAEYLSVLPFALAQAVAELPYLLAQNCLYCFILFWMAGFASTPGGFPSLMLVVLAMLTQTVYN